MDEELRVSVLSVRNSSSTTKLPFPPPQVLILFSFFYLYMGTVESSEPEPDLLVWEVAIQLLLFGLDGRSVKAKNRSFCPLVSLFLPVTSTTANDNRGLRSQTP